MTFSVIILGANSAIPAANRFPSSQLVNCKEQYYLLDCGEGTQIQLRKFKLKFQRIKTIFISHLHGDHIYGLPGLITTMDLLGRKSDLTVVGPKGIQAWLMETIKISGAYLNFRINFIEITKENHAEIVYADNQISVKAIKLKHRIECFGFVLTEKVDEVKLNKQLLSVKPLCIEAIKAAKSGKKHFEQDGKIIELQAYILPPLTARKYAYVTDTLPLKEIVQHIEFCDLLYHEATFAHELLERAIKTYHSTAQQAAEIAQLSKVKKLIIGHFSSRYISLEPLLIEAKAIFPNTILAEEGHRIYIE